eukprot:scaffold130984_cov72-Phaeocystis_antarctica.AAC.2
MEVVSSTGCAQTPKRASPLPRSLIRRDPCAARAETDRASARGRPSRSWVERRRRRCTRRRASSSKSPSSPARVSADAEALMLARRVGNHGAWGKLSRALEVEREDLLEEVGAGVAFGAQEGRGRLRRGRALGLERHAPVRHARERKHASCLLQADFSSCLLQSSGGKKRDIASETRKDARPTVLLLGLLLVLAKLLHELVDAVVEQRRDDALVEAAARRPVALVHLPQPVVAAGGVRARLEALLPRKGGRDAARVEPKHVQRAEAVVAPALLPGVRLLGHAACEETAVVGPHQAHLVLAAVGGRQIGREEEVDVRDALVEVHIAEVDEGAAAAPQVAEEDVLEVDVAVAKRERRREELGEQLGHLALQQAPPAEHRRVDLTSPLFERRQACAQEGCKEQLGGEEAAEAVKVLRVGVRLQRCRLRVPPPSRVEGGEGGHHGGRPLELLLTAGAQPRVHARVANVLEQHADTRLPPTQVAPVERDIALWPGQATRLDGEVVVEVCLLAELLPDDPAWHHRAAHGRELRHHLTWHREELGRPLRAQMGSALRGGHLRRGRHRHTLRSRAGCALVAVISSNVQDIRGSPKVSRLDLRCVHHRASRRRNGGSGVRFEGQVEQRHLRHHTLALATDRPRVDLADAAVRRQDTLVT